MIVNHGVSMHIVYIYIYFRSKGDNVVLWAAHAMSIGGAEIGLILGPGVTVLELAAETCN